MLTSVVKRLASSRSAVVGLVCLSALGGLAIFRAEPSYAAPSGCVNRVFSRSEEFTPEACVRDLQGMLDNLWRHQTAWNSPSLPQLTWIAGDGFYGQNTYDDVKSFNEARGIPGDPPRHEGRTTAQTWSELCLMVLDVTHREGDDYVNAGCPTPHGLSGREGSGGLRTFRG